MPRALISVWDKSGIVEFARGLISLDFEIISTGGTAKHLRDAGIQVTDVSEVTGFPEIMDGRVKTLHPVIAAGLLADTNNPEHRRALQEQSILPITVLAVNLYPFLQTVSKDHTPEEAIEMIDIGGPTMLRAAAKNHTSVTAIVDPKDYEQVLSELNAGGVAENTRRSLMAKVFAATAAYDTAIADYFGGRTELRYGENPSQRAAAIPDPSFSGASVLHAEVLSGKPLSYNNILDADAAMAAVLEFAEPAAVVVKHLTPCGAAVNDSPADAIRKAIDADSTSAFGGVVAVNSVIGVPEADELLKPGQFLEVILSRGFSPEAHEMIANRSGWGVNVRVLSIGNKPYRRSDETRSVAGGRVWQSAQPDVNAFRIVTQRQPSATEKRDLEFAWRIVRYVKSNAIVVARDGVTLGIGAGQTSRVGSTKIALARAGDVAQGAVMASDGFFPFPDSIEEAAAHGIAAVIQPGGSKKDEEVIAAADRLGIAMVFTVERQFRH